MTDLHESLLLKALRGEKTSRPPVWFMRQAGRFLPEYREIRAKHSMLDVIRTPELAAEVTLQPTRRFTLDGAILFADILNPLIGLGVDLCFEKGVGPVIKNPIDDAAAVRALRLPEVEQNSGYSLEAIRLICQELAPKGIPLLGFAGAPFTLSAYMIEGQGSNRFEKARAFMYEQKDAWHELQTLLVALLSEYLIAKVEAGVSAVQIFDSWLGLLSPSDYTTYVEPYLVALIENVKAAVSVPVLFFATGIAGLYPLVGRLPADVFGIDWRVTLPQARALLDRDVPLQGNLDPIVLAKAPWEQVEAEARRIVSEGRTLRSHIFNVGHGFIPSTPIEQVQRLVTLIHSLEE